MNAVREESRKNARSENGLLKNLFDSKKQLVSKVRKGQVELQKQNWKSQ